jgi:hypothetical protein
LDERFHAAGLAHVQEVCMRFLCAGFGGLGHNLLEAIFAARAQQKFRPFSAESASGRRAESAGSTSDEDPFIG